MILVTGGAGFLGRGLIPELLSSGHRVVVADRAPDPGSGVEHRRVDLLEVAADPTLLDGAEAVIHLAARAHMVSDRARDPLAEFRRLNRDATIALARAGAAAGVRRFIFLSSIGVLGERTTPGRPFTAGSVPAPTAPYAISKFEAERGLAEVAAATGLEVVTIRPPLVHGPGAPGNFRRLLRLVASGFPLPLAAVDGRRTFVSRANLCSLIVTSMTHPDAPRAPLLAGDSETLTLPELLRILAAGMGRPLRLFPMPGMSLAQALPVIGRPLRKLTDSLVVDTSETVARLGWTPFESAEAGLTAMARAWRDAR